MKPANPFTRLYHWFRHREVEVQCDACHAPQGYFTPTGEHRCVQLCANCLSMLKAEWQWYRSGSHSAPLEQEPWLTQWQSPSASHSRHSSN